MLLTKEVVQTSARNYQFFVDFLLIILEEGAFYLMKVFTYEFFVVKFMVVSAGLISLLLRHLRELKDTCVSRQKLTNIVHAILYKASHLIRFNH
jgi:hypothetical protein